MTKDPPFRQQDPVRRTYLRLATDYDLRWTKYTTATVRETLQRLDLDAGDRLLDIGCGTGILLDLVRRASPSVRLAGVDLSPEMLCVAARRLGVGEEASRVPQGDGSSPPAVLVAADVMRLPFPGATFDAAVSSNSLHYWPKPREALREIARVLRPGGQFVLTDWCDDYLTCRVFDRVLRIVDPAHHRAYGTRACAELLTSNGYVEPQLERYKIDWLWGLMTATCRRQASPE